MDCRERRDQILLWAAGTLDEAECVELRQHLASGCPQCAGYLAEAQATLAMFPLALPAAQPPASLKSKILSEIHRESRMRIGGWDRIVRPAAVAAVLAVAVTLLTVRQFWPNPNPHSPGDVTAISTLEAELISAQGQLSAVKHNLGDMEFAELSGDAQPRAVGHVFLDPDMKKWYFFACGMRPAEEGKTYELWLIYNDQKLPAGTFDIGETGTATLLGTIPPLPSNASVKLAVTDEPMQGDHQTPTGHLQMKGEVVE